MNNLIPDPNKTVGNYELSIPLAIRPDICYIGRVSDRGVTKEYGILQDDRRRHMYILGKSGMGKSTLLENMILQDIYNGHGVCFIDPHGDSSHYILDHIPSWRTNDVVYFNPADMEYPVGFNMLEAQRGEQAFLITSGMMAIFGRIWEGAWSSRMEYILNNTLLALLETPGNTLLGVVRLLTDNDFREIIVRNLQDPLVKNFWVKEFASFNDKYRTEAIAPILNKIGQFFSTDLIRNILGQPKSTIDFREIMDNKKILIVNLSKGSIGEDNSNLLGSFLITKLQLAAMSRVDIPEETRNDFYLYVDEFQNFTTDSFATILSEARKYRLNLVLAHQYISQLTESGNDKVRNAIFGNVSTMISFRVGSDDAEVLEKEYEPIFTSPQLLSLNKFQIALKLSINGKPSLPFMSNTLPQIFANNAGTYSKVVQQSRERNALVRAKAQGKINTWLNKDYNLIISEENRKKQATYEKKKAEQNKKGPLSESEVEKIRNQRKQERTDKKKYNPFLQPTRDNRNQGNKSDFAGRNNPSTKAGQPVRKGSDRLKNPKSGINITTKPTSRTQNTADLLSKLRSLKDKK